MKGDTFSVDGEQATEHECENCGDDFVEPASLKSGSRECPSCSGGVLG